MLRSDWFQKRVAETVLCEVVLWLRRKLIRRFHSHFNYKREVF